MSSTRELHHTAMELYEHALLASRQGDRRRSLELLRKALAMEVAAADSVAVDLELEPTRSVLHRSAASIALRLGDVATATRYTEAGLRGNPPPEIRDELTVLREKILTLEAETTDYRLKAPVRPTPVQQIVRRFTATAPVNILGLADALGLAVREAELGNEISGEIFADVYRGGY